VNDEFRGIFAYPFIRVFNSCCTLSDLPIGSKRKIKALTATARKVAGCFNFLYFHALSKIRAMIMV
jgi:hypothetical protein